MECMSVDVCIHSTCPSVVFVVVVVLIVTNLLLLLSVMYNAASS